ncbi:hypothetical protein G3578_09345 [Brevibacillus sp. SYP-B805]|nr:hypothetical protein [Brevibacillus sp. SYP-B805]
MPMIFLMLILLLAGCQATPPAADPAVPSDRSAYLLQSDVHPLGGEPDFTPYGTPTNMGTSSDYNRSIRIDAVSNY